jgi:hypothetical protein
MRLGHQARTTAPGGRPPHRPAPFGKGDRPGRFSYYYDYPSAAHRRSYNRRTSAERTFATIKDPAATSIARGWCRQMGLTPLTLWLACALTVRNQRILAAWDARQADNTRRAAAGLAPRTRKRRRRTLASLTAAPP